MSEDGPRDYVEGLLRSRCAYELPVPVDRIARAIGASILPTYRLSRDVPGYLYHGPAHPVIVLNGNDPKTRQRFTIGHELWHLLFDDEPGVRLFDPASWENHASWRERSAHSFAQELLMPADLFLAAWEEHHSFPTLLRQTGASKQAVNRRMRDLGLLH